MKSLLTIIFILTLLMGCTQQQQQQPEPVATVETPKSTGSVDLALLLVIEKFEEEDLRMYPRESKRLSEAAKRLEPSRTRLTPAEVAYLKKAADSKNAQKVLFVVQLLLDHELEGEFVESTSRTLLKSEEPELQWYSTWNLSRKQTRLGPLEVKTLESLVGLLQQLLGGERDNRRDHAQLILQILEKTKNAQELKFGAVHDNFEALFSLAKKPGLISNAPLVRSVLSILGQAPSEAQKTALGHIASIEAEEPEFFREEIEAARQALE